MAASSIAHPSTLRPITTPAIAPTLPHSRGESASWIVLSRPGGACRALVVAMAPSSTTSDPKLTISSGSSLAYLRPERNSELV